ncbi:EAL domain-containing protein [Pseudoxanthomonas winnipegensis]|jgi:EAL domain-containing protein (putative c-di-GMP-specific phosphodiesterase class I)/DNA-binding response OmpR family regulator|uniref:EAL domain-containing protein n=1 Tax=Pseudoxanthomonas winnipegensis TaxID=2480810 RepID=A0A4Q8LDI0_9GAMM|nr:EAL domain-containing protein [Pseudoxanthomonas winnipegensis]TAA26736.1 EAL domain-containing protein [Pseudoxanthomonas winnipegensis]
MPAPPSPTSSPSSSPRPLVRAEMPPPHYWRRWTDDVPALSASAEGDPDDGAGAGLPGAPGAPPAAGAAGGEGGPAESPYRVLIVEDDRPQALFAQSVLHGAGMLAEVEMDADKVIDSIQRFVPDLLLMDLHMPGQDGMSLTVAIRERPEYLDLPIVFLTGDPDPERQYDALDSGADDFLTKPIRPRHLIAAVSNRIRRMRQRLPVQVLASAAPEINQTPLDVNPETGLHTRAYVQQQLTSALEEHADGGLFFIEIAGALGLRDRYGYAAFEQLMSQAARQLSGFAAPHPLARLNDNSFLAVARGLPREGLEGFARSLHDQLAKVSLPVRASETIQLRAIIGYSELALGFADRDAALEAVEHAAVAARSQPGHVAAHVPAPSASEQARASLADTTLELLFQPIVSVAGGDQAQFQVLMRLRQADGTLLPAAQVVPAAELSGDIVDLDRQIITRALDLIAKRKVEGAELRLFVSQSPLTLSRAGAADWLIGEIRRRGIEPSSLVVDLRLSDALIHTVALRDFSQAPMQAGVQFCLSQFEPGTDAEALLSLLPLSYLRVSSRFAGAHKDAALRGQLRATIDLAHRQNLLVIGQQIEDPQAAAAMWMGGVDFIQGNLVQGVGQDLGFDFHNAVL